ncbi:cell division ATP-binding protein FtsE [Desulfovermiculus halophilus]|jgi:cell division transport system ATP-binding protein|uniref:cell division ATP-binding protein FtsE n=1 Tax=Desulfovermiculus halophilus TaxID=339722 RepID=UPI00054E9E97|nr:ATP-binding cassette domain-containing protein [Desulfovermiculus halophilus]
MHSTPTIRLKHLSHSFVSSWALKNISLDVTSGEFVFLTGPSGAGKTTLLCLLHGALPLQRGMASIAGHDLGSLTSSRLHLLRREVTVVFQDFKVLPQRSVRENIALPLVVRGFPSAQIHKRVNAVLRGLSLDGKGHTPCGRLSGGEQQRVAIARSIVVNPKVILADEPTGNLDPELSLRLLDIFGRFNAHGTTVLLATHDQNLIRAMPQARVVHLVDGQLQGEGHVPPNAGL